MEAKKLRLEGIVKVFWILVEELGEGVEMESEKEVAAAIAEEIYTFSGKGEASKLKRGQNVT